MTAIRETREEPAAPESLPRWDLSAAFPGLDSPEFIRGFQAIGEGISDLERLFDAEGIGGPDTGDQADAAPIEVVEQVVSRVNALLDRVEIMGAYLEGEVATDSRNDLAQARFSEFENQIVRLAKLMNRLTAWIGTLDIDALVDASALIAAHAYPLRLEKQAAAHLMSTSLEGLAAELDP